MHLALAHAGARVDAVFYCPHGAEAGCNCRKPKPGMLEDIAHRFNVDLTDVPCVGDSLRDLQASHAAGCTPWLVQTGNGPRTLAQGDLPRGTRLADSLAAMVDQLLAEG